MPISRASENSRSLSLGSRRLKSLGVLVTCFLYMALSGGAAASMAVLIVEFLDYFHQSKFLTSWCSSLCLTLTLGTAPIWMIMLQKVNHRRIIIAGVLASVVGLFTSSFATSIYHLYVSFGIVTGVVLWFILVITLIGLGYGMVTYTSVIYVSEYFTKYQYLAVGLIHTGTAVGSMVIPPVLHALVAAYTWRGALMIMAAAMLQLLVLVCFITTIAKEPGNSSHDTREDDEMGSKCTAEDENFHRGERSNVNAETRFILDESVVATGLADCEERCTNKFTQLDGRSRKENMISILRQWQFYPFIFTVTLAVFHAYIYFTFNMHYFLSLGMSHHQAVTLVMSAGIGNVCGRVTTSIFTQYVHRRRCVILLGADLIFAISFFFTFRYSNYALFAMLSVFVGFAHGCRTAGGSTVVLELFGVARSREEIALVLLALGLGALLGPPAGGLVFDITHQYSSVFMMCMVLALICAAVISPVLLIAPRPYPPAPETNDASMA